MGVIYFGQKLELALKILERLVSFPSITPLEKGSLSYIENFLSERSFTITREEIDGASCLYARRGRSGKNFCFSGHVDVVPTGDLSLWSSNPFEMVRRNGLLIGRGVCDMKGGIASFLSALDSLIKSNPNLLSKNSISIMLTSDEEKAGITSCKSFLEELTKKGEKIDYCLIGEPTSYKAFGDSIKVGRRGSVTIDIKVTGLGGHVAYPKLCNNPLKVLVPCLEKIQTYQWDKGNEVFEPSNLEVVSINSSENVSNMVPNYANAKINIRFNVLQTTQSIENTIGRICGDSIKPPFHYELKFKSGNKPFVSSGTELLSVAKSAIKECVGIEPSISTGGGASDGSYISEYCNELIEFGATNLMAHKIDESIHESEIGKLVMVYKKIVGAIMSK